MGSDDKKDKILQRYWPVLCLRKWGAGWLEVGHVQAPWAEATGVVRRLVTLSK